MRAILSIMLSLFALLATSCAPRKDVIKEVPVTQVVEHGVVKVPIEQDSTTLRLVVDCLPNGTPVIRQTGSALSPLQLNWAQNGNDLLVRAKSPPKDALIPYRVVTREVPVEVPVEVETNVLYWWQKGLMYLGAITLITLIIKLIITLKTKKYG